MEGNGGLEPCSNGSALASSKPLAVGHLQTHDRAVESGVAANHNEGGSLNSTWGAIVPLLLVHLVHLGHDA